MYVHMRATYSRARAPPHAHTHTLTRRPLLTSVLLHRGVGFLLIVIMFIISMVIIAIILIIRIIAIILIVIIAIILIVIIAMIWIVIIAILSSVGVSELHWGPIQAQASPLEGQRDLFQRLLSSRIAIITISRIAIITINRIDIITINRIAIITRFQRLLSRIVEFEGARSLQRRVHGHARIITMWCVQKSCRHKSMKRTAEPAQLRCWKGVCETSRKRMIFPGEAARRNRALPEYSMGSRSACGGITGCEACGGRLACASCTTWRPRAHSGRNSGTAELRDHNRLNPQDCPLLYSWGLSLHVTAAACHCWCIPFVPQPLSLPVWQVYSIFPACRLIWQRVREWLIESHYLLIVHHNAHWVKFRHVGACEW